MKTAIVLSILALTFSATQAFADMRADRDGCHIMTPAGEMHFPNCAASVWHNEDGTLSGGFSHTQDYIHLPFTKSVRMTSEESDVLCALGDANNNTHSTGTWETTYQVNNRGDGNYLTPSTITYIVSCSGAKQI